MGQWWGMALTGVGWALLIAPVVAAITALVFRGQRQAAPWQAACLTTYGCILAAVTQIPLQDASGETICNRNPVRLTPGNSLVTAVDKLNGETLLGILGSHYFLQILMNIALFLLVGVMVAAFFKKGAAWGALAGFLTSLAVELTQVTGVWGLYDCAYRIFDVDDLFTNTLGAFLGAVLWRALRIDRDTGFL